MAVVPIRKFVVQCDDKRSEMCLRETVPFDDEELLHWLKRLGWLESDGKWTCPECQKAKADVAESA